MRRATVAPILYHRRCGHRAFNCAHTGCILCLCSLVLFNVLCQAQAEADLIAEQVIVNNVMYEDVIVPQFAAYCNKVSARWCAF